MKHGVGVQEVVVEALHDAEAGVLRLQRPQREGHGGELGVDLAKYGPARLHLQVVGHVWGPLVHLRRLLIQNLR